MISYLPLRASSLFLGSVGFPFEDGILKFHKQNIRWWMTINFIEFFIPHIYKRQIILFNINWTTGLSICGTSDLSFFFVNLLTLHMMDDRFLFYFF